jgi:hypothetical protein
MKRLVYSPSINVWIKTDTGIFDLSPYITNCTVDRRINSVSYAQVEFRNPKILDPKSNKTKFMFTEHVSNDGSIRPMFHPMDPIIITMTRLKGHPVQVFTGYCDTSPYVQVYPGVAKLEASCTLKRLQYTYWDPALPFVRQFMQKHGWGIDKSGTALNPSAEKSTGDSEVLDDTSIGGLLYSVLRDIGGWNKDHIYIQELPGDKIGKLVAQLFKDTAKEEADSIKQFHDFLHDVIGASAYGSAGGGVPSGPAPTGGGQPASVGAPLAIKGKLIGGSNVVGSTHDPNAEPNNWQSDNALDIEVPVGTGVFAVDDGTITNVRGYYTDGTGRFEGLRFTLVTKDNEWFYQHNSARYVHEGQKVKKGALLAKSGSGNGVPHLHIGCKNGKPETLLGY